MPNNHFVLRRIRLKKCSVHTISKGWTEVTGYVRKKRKTRKPPTAETPLSENTQVIVSKDGCFIYRDGADYWVCPLTGNERKLVAAVAAAGGKLDGDLAFEALWPDKKTIDEKMMRNVIGGINRRIKDRLIPVRLSFSDCYVSILQKSVP